MIEFPKKEILMDYIIRLCDFLMGKNAENSKKNPKIQINLENANITQEIQENTQKIQENHRKFQINSNKLR